MSGFQGLGGREMGGGRATGVGVLRLERVMGELWNQMPVSRPELRGLRERENWRTRGGPCLLPECVVRGHRSVCLTPDARREHSRPVLGLHVSLRRVQTLRKANWKLPDSSRRRAELLEP